MQKCPYPLICCFHSLVFFHPGLGHVSWNSLRLFSVSSLGEGSRPITASCNRTYKHCVCSVLNTELLFPALLSQSHQIGNELHCTPYLVPSLLLHLTSLFSLYFMSVLSFILFLCHYEAHWSQLSNIFSLSHICLSIAFYDSCCERFFMKTNCIGLGMLESTKHNSLSVVQKSGLEIVNDHHYISPQGDQHTLIYFYNTLYKLLEDIGLNSILTLV